MTFLESLGLHKKNLRAWALYGWADCAFSATIMAAVLPIYFADVAAIHLPKHIRSAYWGYTTGIGLLIVAVISPIIGAAADYLCAKKKFFSIFLMLGVISSVLFYFVGEGDWKLCSILFILGNIGFGGANVFYEALLPHIANGDEVDRVSAASYGIGYLGGGIFLSLNLLLIMKSELFGFSTIEATKLCFVAVGVWWFLFSLPLLFFVSEPGTLKNETSGENFIFASIKRIFETFREIKKYKEVIIFLIAFWFYSDSIGTIIKMATIYGREIGIGSNDLIGALLLVHFIGVPCAFVFGYIGSKIGPKKGITIALCFYIIICIFGFQMTTAFHFWILACMVALVQGGSQALSRSLYATIIPKSRSSEFFGFFSVSSKFAGIFGPLIFGFIAELLGASRYSILFLIAFFVIGIIFLNRVNVEEARSKSFS